MFPAPHGAVCASLLPHVMSVNVSAIRERSPGSGALAKYDEIAVLLAGRADATANDAVDWTGRLCQRLAIPPLRTYGITERDIPVLVEKAQSASSMKGNPITLTPAELREILIRGM
jgi:alcohol dehydrogenase class IV